MYSRAPRGACGLKHFEFDYPPDRFYCRAPRGACGLIGVPEDEDRAPRGACGLKQVLPDHRQQLAVSRPSRGVRIETTDHVISCTTRAVAPLAGRAD